MGRSLRVQIAQTIWDAANALRFRIKLSDNETARPRVG
jgi:hypothetical protein